MKSAKLRGVICVVLASLCYGVTPILSSTAIKGGMPADFLTRVLGSAPAALAADPANAVSNECVVGISMAIACLFSLALCLITRKSLAVQTKQLWQLGLFGAGGLTATMLLLTYSYLYITPGVALVLNFAYPVLVLIVSALFFKEGFGALKTLALAVAIIGILLLSGVFFPGSGASSGFKAEGAASATPGIVLALASAAAYAAYFLAGRHASYYSLETGVCNVYITGFSAVICLAVAAFTGRFTLPRTPFIWLMLLGEGTLGMIIGLRLLLRGIKLLGSAAASALNTLEPVFVMMTSSLVYGTLVDAPKLVGAVLVLAAALISILAINGGRAKTEKKA